MPNDPRDNAAALGEQVVSGTGQDAAREASDYFYSLSLEQRRKLAPLLEDYRRRGIEEARQELRAASRKLAARSKGIAKHMDAVDAGETIASIHARAAADTGSGR